MLIPEHKIEEVLERTDLVGLISRHVELKKAGRSFKGCCPFHQEKSPSFHVTPEIRRFKCFGCQAGGDAIAFVQRYLGKTFVDAVRELAREAGVDLATAEDPGARERQELREATDAALEHFRSRLWDPTVGKPAREYLAERGVSEETAKLFGLGWAPQGWDELVKRLMHLGVLDFGVNAGLAQKRNRGEGFFDVFRSRLMIPIRSSEGRTLAFGGRLLELDAATAERGGPKYLNSKESRLYNKSEVLYGIDLAREEIRRRKSAILVEGYFDCIGLHQVGVKHAVALCSTALTPGHLKLLARYDVKELVLLLDGDEAGRKAVERLASSLLSHGTAARVALLPEGEDPDTFAQREGSAGMDRLVAAAKPLTEHLFHVILPEGPDASFEAKMQALGRLKAITQQLPVGLARSAFFTALARHSGLPAAELEAELRGKPPAPLQPVPKPSPRAASPQQHGGARGSTEPGVPAAAPTVRQVKPPDALEAAFVAAILKVPRLAAVDAYRVQDELAHTSLRLVLARVAQGALSADIYEEMPLPVQRSLAAAAHTLPKDEAALERDFRGMTRKLKLRRIEEQLAHIAQVTGAAQGTGDLNDEVRRLVSERISLLALKKQVLEELTPSPAGTKGGGHLV